MGDRALFECRVNVLTSQHEDSLFVVKFRVESFETNETFELCSRSMKVISKPSLFNKRKRCEEPISPEYVYTPKKGSSSPVDSVALESLARLEKQLQEQRNLIEKLLLQQVKAPIKEDSFEQSFENFLAAYNHLSSEEKPAKLRRLFNTLSSSSMQRLEEFCRLFGISGCASSLDCPHKIQLSSWETFCDELGLGDVALKPLELLSDIS